ncbi:MAG TPA: helix-turn-helix domain-containing protein [Terriglobales bacterium]|nr:helix-turn-helix domain-containing protein [Terriglobales bacterium]
MAKLISDRAFAEKRRVELGEIADATGIHRSTLSRIMNVPGSNVTAANMDRLCRYFECSLGELAEYVPDGDGAPESEPSQAAASTNAKPASASAKAKRGA